MLAGTLVAVLLAASPWAADTVKWGATVNGIRMRAAIMRNDFGNLALEWTIQNTTSDEIYLLLGSGIYKSAELLDGIVTESDGSEYTAQYLASGGGGAHSGPFPPPKIVLMLPKSSYSVQTLLGAWAYTTPQFRLVETLASQRGSLRLRLRVGEDNRYYSEMKQCYGVRRYWTGTLVSNSLQFPLR